MRRVLRARPAFSVLWQTGTARGATSRLQRTSSPDERLAAAGQRLDKARADGVLHAVGVLISGKVVYEGWPLQLALSGWERKLPQERRGLATCLGAARHRTSVPQRTALPGAQSAVSKAW